MTISTATAPHILHRVGIKNTSLDDVYAALTTRDGLAGFWSSDTRGTGELGEVLDFHFKAAPEPIRMKVVELAPARRVVWEVVGGPEEWIGGHVSFDLHQDGDWAIVLFKQEWREEVEFMYHCTTKWAVVLLSLKSLLETGTGTPEPNDKKIDNWN
jgi:hypothetical protein